MSVGYITKDTSLKDFLSVTIQVDRHIRRFSIHGFSYQQLAAARKKIWKIKEINGS